MIKSLFEDGMNLKISPEDIEKVFFATLDGDEWDQLAIRRLQIEIWKKVYETVAQEIYSKFTPF